MSPKSSPNNELGLLRTISYLTYPQITQTMKHITAIILFLLLSYYQGIGQGLESQYSDTDGNFLRLGPPPGGISGSTNLYFGKDKIETFKSGVVFGGLRPTLRLNPVSGNVTIGPTDGDFSTLTIKSYVESNDVTNGVDIRLEGHGRIGTQGSMYIQIDDNNTADEFFSIKDSGWGDLFYVGENGSNYLKGDITIDGDVTVNGSISADLEMKVIEIGCAHFIPNNDEVIEYTFINVIGNTCRLEDSHGSMLGAFSLPHNAIVNKVELLYYDNSSSDIEFWLYSYNSTSYNASGLTQHILYDSSSSDDVIRKASFENLNFQVDNIDRSYHMGVESSDWGLDKVEFRAVKIYYME